jgi:hypothetical protein
MITGFNTDIDFEGQVFHVQTEDKGIDNPVIETLVYTGGQILCARKNSYSELIISGTCEEQPVQRRMETQHREMIRDIRDGTLSKEELEPFGRKFISNRSFDEVVRVFLEEEVPVEKIRIEVLEPEDLHAGENTTIKLAVTEETTERPIPGANVVVKLVGKQNSAVLFEARTDERGQVATPCALPIKPGVGATLLCEAVAEDFTAEVSCRVKRRRTRSSVQPT